MAGEQKFLQDSFPNSIMVNSRRVKELYKNLKDWVLHRRAYIYFMEEIAIMMRWMTILFSILQIVLWLLSAIAEAYSGIYGYIDYVGYFEVTIGIGLAFAVALLKYWATAFMLIQVVERFSDDGDNYKDIVRKLVVLRLIAGPIVHLSEKECYFHIGFRYTVFSVLCRSLIWRSVSKAASFSNCPYFAFVFFVLDLYEAYKVWAYKVLIPALEEIWLEEKIVELKDETNIFIAAINEHKMEYQDVRNLPDIQSPFPEQ